jgi:hypothetical protein
VGATLGPSSRRVRPQVTVSVRARVATWARRRCRGAGWLRGAQQLRVVSFGPAAASTRPPGRHTRGSLPPRAVASALHLDPGVPLSLRRLTSPGVVAPRLEWPQHGGRRPTHRRPHVQQVQGVIAIAPHGAPCRPRSCLQCGYHEERGRVVHRHLVLKQWVKSPKKTRRPKARVIFLLMLQQHYHELSPKLPMTAQAVPQPAIAALHTQTSDQTFLDSPWTTPSETVSTCVSPFDYLTERHHLRAHCTIFIRTRTPRRKRSLG